VESVEGGRIEILTEEGSRLEVPVDGIHQARIEPEF
jgi:hypothetical protein